MLTAVRWTARALEGIVAAYFLLFLFREGVPAPTLLTINESFAVLGIAIAFAGLLSAWMWEGPGGGLMLAGYLLAAMALPSVVSMRMFHVMAVAGILSLGGWWLGKKAGKPVTIVLSSRLITWYRRWRNVLAAAEGLVILLFLNELFLTPPFMSPEMDGGAAAGRWEGRSTIVSDWVRQHRLRIAVVIGTDGRVRGTIGDATLIGGRIDPNRSWFGSALRWRSDYIISGALMGMVVAPESIARAEVRIPLTVAGARLVGCVSAEEGGNDARGDLQCSRLSMFKPGPDRSVTFRVRPVSIPDASGVYLTGDNDLFGNWEPAGAALDREPDGTWSRTFRFPAGMILYFNFTRGSWRTQALDATGSALPNGMFEVRRDTIIQITVGRWADIIM
jgi:hypothetical protein